MNSTVDSTSSLFSPTTSSAFEDEESLVDSCNTTFTSVPRPIAAFSLWCRDHRATIAKKNSNKKYVSKTLSARWRKLSAEEKFPYQEKARQMKEDYEAEYGKSGNSEPRWIHEEPPKDAYEVFADLKIQNLSKSHKHLDTAVIKKELEQIWNNMSEQKKLPFEEMYQDLIQKENQGEPKAHIRIGQKRAHQKEPFATIFSSVFDSPPSNVSSRFQPPDYESTADGNPPQSAPECSKNLAETVNKTMAYSSPIQEVSIVQPNSSVLSEPTNTWMDTHVPIEEIKPTFTFSEDFPWEDVCDGLGVDFADLSL